MAVTGKAIIQKQVTDAAAGTSYTAPAGTRVRITAAGVCNSDVAVAYTLTVYKFAAGGAAGADTTIINAKSIGAGATEILSELVGHIMDPGDVIQALASATLKLNLWISGALMT